MGPSLRDQLKRHYNLRKYWIEVDLQDLLTFDSQLADKLIKLPAEFLPLVSRHLRSLCVANASLRASMYMHVRTQFEDAAKQAADELTQPRPLGEEKMEEIQVMLKSDANPMQIRQLEV